MISMAFLNEYTYLFDACCWMLVPTYQSRDGGPLRVTRDSSVPRKIVWLWPRSLGNFWCFWRFWLFLIDQPKFNLKRVLESPCLPLQNKILKLRINSLFEPKKYIEKIGNKTWNKSLSGIHTKKWYKLKSIFSRNA